MARTTTRKSAKSTTSLTEVKKEQPVKRANNVKGLETQAKSYAAQAMSDNRNSDALAGTAEQRMIAAVLVEVEYLAATSNDNTVPSLTLVDAKLDQSSEAKSTLLRLMKEAFLVPVNDEFKKGKSSEEIAAAQADYNKQSVLVRKGLEGAAIFAKRGMGVEHFDADKGLFRVTVAMLCDPVLRQQTAQHTPTAPVLLDGRTYAVWRYAQNEKGEDIVDGDNNKRVINDYIRSSFAQFKLAQTKVKREVSAAPTTFNVDMNAPDHGVSRLVQHGDPEALIIAAYQVLFAKDAEKDGNGKIVFSWSGFSKEARNALEHLRMVADECDAEETQRDAA